MKITIATFAKAWEFAHKAHKGQKRKGNEQPYIEHPISVMLTINRLKKSSNPYALGAAALLHDTVEDCNITLEQIAKEFGFTIAAMVEELTLDKTKYKTIGKSQYLAQEMLDMSSYSLALKLSDRYNNCLDMSGMDKSFKKKYKEETRYILSKLKKRKLTKTHKKLIKLIKKTIN